MKIIHCADLHLDSKMSTNLTGEQAKERRAELLHTYLRMLDYAKEHAVEVILIAGDLFDTRNISAAAKNTVLNGIMNHPQIDFYYLKGNHDTDSFFDNLKMIPENLKLFQDQWTHYELDADGKIILTGVEIHKDNISHIYQSLLLKPDRFNIVMLHGQEMEYRGKDKTESIHLRELRNKGIDYLALGHVHEYKEGALDSRGTWCYSGCLEGRGFDECGKHGFILLDIDEDRGSYTKEFIPFASRNLYTVPIDISGSMTTDAAAQFIKNTLEQKNFDKKHMLKLVLTGSVDVGCEINKELLRKQFEKEYYFLKIQDESDYKVDYPSFLLDESLKGEFVRTVMGDEFLKEEEKAAIIRYGIQALAGEEIQ